MMKRKRQKALTFLLALLCAISAATPIQAAVFTPERMTIGQAITVHVDGTYIAADVQPMMLRDRVFLPMRAAAEYLGAYVYWDGATRCVTVQKDGNSAYFFADSPYYYLNGETKVSDASPMISQGRTMLPIRVFAEAIGADVYWDGNMQDVRILTGGPVKGTCTVPSIIPYNLHPVIQKYYVEPSQPGVGSWYSIMYDAGETYYEILSISALSDGSRQAIHAISKDYQGDGTADFISIYQDPVSANSSGFVLHRGGMQSSFYESDGFLGHTFTYPSNDYYTYSTGDRTLYRTYRDQPNMSFSGQTTVFVPLA